MNDVKDLCGRILDGPAPPMRDSAHVLAVARRAARRRVRVAVGVSGLTAAAIVAVTALAGTLPTASRTPRPAVVLTAAVIPSQPKAPPGPRIAALLAEALPAGYSARPAFGSHDTETGNSRTRLIVSTAKGEGTLSATVVRDGTAAPSGDMCSPAVSARLNAHLPDGDANCEVITIEGVPIRATTTPHGSTAARFLAGGFLTIDWNSGDDGRNPFTLRQLATVAASVQIPE